MFLYMWGELSYNYDWKAPDMLSRLMELAKATALSPGQFAFFKQLLVKDNRMKRGGPRSMTFTPSGPVESSPSLLVRRKSIIFKLRKSRSKTDDFMPLWFSIEAELMAQQITQLEHEHFCTIKVHELIPGTKHDSVDALAARFNEVANWVATQILCLPQPKMQASAIKRFVVIIEQLLELNNFQSSGQILSGLYNSSVRRLKRTWALLSSKTQARLEKLEDIMSPTQNFLKLRDLIKVAEDKPLIPYLPLVLRDITFMNDGNPNKNDDGSVNFDKILTLGKYLLWFKAIVGAQYRLPLDTTVQKLLLDLKPLDEEEMYKRSLEIEPKNSPALSAISSSGLSSSQPLTLPPILEL